MDDLNKMFNVAVDVRPLTPKFEALTAAARAFEEAYKNLISSTDELTYTYEEETN